MRAFLKNLWYGEEVWILEFWWASYGVWSRYHLEATTLEVALYAMHEQALEYQRWTFRIRNILTEEVIPGAIL